MNDSSWCCSARRSARLPFRTCLAAGSVLVWGSIAEAQTTRPVQPQTEAAPDTKPEAPLPPLPAEPKKEPIAPVTSRWQALFYGFVEFDGMYDTTQSFSDSPGNTPVLRSDGSTPAYLPLGTDPPKGISYASTHGRVQATARNTRFGFKLTPPEYAGIKSSGTVEVDFFGNQPTAPYGFTSPTSEGSFFTSAALRLRHAYLKVETEVVDVLLGQYYNLFGWQPYFFPGTLSFLGTPNMVFGRTPQVRLSKIIKTDPINVELAAAALRPPQRDSAYPSFEGGVRLEINHWKGPHGRGSGQPTLDGAGIGVSATRRWFRVIEFANNRADLTFGTDVAEAGGYGVSFDGFLPIIPARDLENRSLSLVLTGSWVKGAGTADLYTGGLTGGVQFPLPAGPNGPNTGIYGSNIDPGIVQFDLAGNLRVLNWQSAMAGFQLYLPPGGKLVLTGNYTRGKSDNIGQSAPEGGDPSRTFKVAEYYDGNVFVDITAAVRAGASFQYVRQRYVDGGIEQNKRIEVGGLFFF